MSLADADLLRAVLDSIIPPDQDAGATDLGADVYVMRALAHDCAAWAPAIEAGLAELERAGFAGADAAARAALLTERSTEPWFQVLAELTAEGFYADPGNGGNWNAESWVMIGYEPRLPSEGAR